MSLLQRHLEQISQSAAVIAELPFPPPKPFTNALLEPHDITALIRDTEAHERALFSVDHNKPSRRATRRVTTFANNDNEKDTLASRIYAARDRKNPSSAVARVLGGDMMKAIRQSTVPTPDPSSRSGLDVEVLLRGAEMLCDVYPVAGAKEQIAGLRSRHSEITQSLSHLEARVARQAVELEQLNNSESYKYHDIDRGRSIEPTDEDFERELAEIRDLEARKRRLEERVSGMEKDLGGLLR
ncbi:hypothetical protein FQN57_005649 [Myotisia sp. PD_48]|nr:hypothetical protein FQN57_005649 [Myotisia sp. PD_48]